MRLRPHVGPVARRGLTTLCLILCVVWAFSGDYSFCWDSARPARFDGAVVRKGSIAFWFGPSTSGPDPSVPHGFRILPVQDLRRDRGWQWIPRIFDLYGSTEVVIPIWIPVVICAIPCGMLWKRERRRRIAASIGLCPSCRYDRSGLTSSTLCPECGCAPNR